MTYVSIRYYYIHIIHSLIGILLYNALCVSSIESATKIPAKLHDILSNANGTFIKEALNNSRRIIIGTEVGDTRPYMVYIKLPGTNQKARDYQLWLCGGVIVHEDYILTSAACIEDAKHFYVISGTYKHKDIRTDEQFRQCINNGAKKAVWKCIPRNYVFDGHENDNIRWMNNDIAVVKVEEEFDFTRKIKGCDFVPRPICYNNVSNRYENPGTLLSIAGWGTPDRYGQNTREDQNLLSTNVQVLTKSRCKRRWGKRYHNIIDNYMICTKDVVPDLSEICMEKYVDCTDVAYSDESDEGRRRLSPDFLVHSLHHDSARRDAGIENGGFCENDHGGPVVYGEGVEAIVIGIISACLVKERSNKCYGPFLYTSVWKNKNLINCAIYKDKAPDCSKLFRSSITHTEVEMSWIDHPDGAAKSEIKAMRRKEELERAKQALANETSSLTPLDSADEHLGVIVRKSIEKVTPTNVTPKV